MAPTQAVDDSINQLLTPSMGDDAESVGDSFKRLGSAPSGESSDPSKTNQSTSLMMRATKVELLTAREMEVLALAWDNMRDSRVCVATK